jgi:quercetin dioxygenase-like cupin family protein
VRIIKDAGAYQMPPQVANHWVEHFRSESLSLGTYCIPAGGLDDQMPHREDEIYLVSSGRGRVVTDSGEAFVGPGDVVYVPAGEAHQFVDITEDMTLLVFFAPPYTGRA